MELKVWVEGVVRVVCGVSASTCCQDVVIALAQAIGQTGRYVLVLMLRGTERQLVADECPLQHLSQLGQMAAEVQFVLRRTGPSRSDAPDRDEVALLLPRPQEPQPLKVRQPQKALSFSLGPSTFPRRTKSKRARSPSPRSSPEPRVSTPSLLDPHGPELAAPSKEEVFRQLLQQQRWLQELEVQLQALEQDSEQWERWEAERTLPAPTRISTEELEELELRWRSNVSELRSRELWEEQLQQEQERERELEVRLRQAHVSAEELGRGLQELRQSGSGLQTDLRHRQEQALRPLQEELRHRVLLGRDLDASLATTHTQLAQAQDTLQLRLQQMEELSRELRQCHLQHFIQHSDLYISNAAIVDQQQEGKHS